METIENLNEWFNNLDITWKRLFKQEIDINHKPSEDEIREILDLKELDCSNSYIISIDPLKHFKELRSLNISNTKIKKINKLSQLTNLEHLDISHTLVSSLIPLGNLNKLKTLNCSSTKISSLEGLDTLQNLVQLDCSGTEITSLDPVKHLNIDEDVIYYNTPYYEQTVLAQEEFDINEKDELFIDAAITIVQTQQGATSLLQRKLKLGYSRAGRIMDQLEAAGVVGPFLGNSAREVFVPNEAILIRFLDSGYDKFSDFQKNNEIKPEEEPAPKKKGFWQRLFG